MIVQGVRMFGLRLPLLAALALIAGACVNVPVGNGGYVPSDGSTTGSNDAVGGGGTPVAHGGSATLTEFFDSLAELYCDYLAQPCCAPANLAYNKAACRAKVGSMFLAAPKVANYDPAKGKACLDALSLTINTGKCQDSPTDSSAEGRCSTGSNSASGIGSPACGWLDDTGTTGTKKLGETCANSKDCVKSPLGEVSCTSYTADGVTTKFCQVWATSYEGEGCNDGWPSSTVANPTVAHECASGAGLRCDYVNKVCVALKTDGESCAADDECICGDWCAKGNCAPQLKNGAPCTVSDDPGQHACAKGHYCEPAAKVCAMQKVDGQPCTFGAECQAGACSVGSCGSLNNATSLSSFCGN